MKEHPILYTGWNVRAILEGLKTQTRRVIKPQPACDIPGAYFDAYNGGPQWNWWTADNQVCNGHEIIKCPYGVPGDRLWVKETWQLLRGDSTDPETGYMDGEWEYPQRIPRKHPGGNWGIAYKADSFGLNAWPDDVEERGFPWRPSIFMPRWASRITLEVVDVRVQCIEEISNEDICAEGISCGHPDCSPSDFCSVRLRKWIDLWNSINLKRGFGWDTGPLAFAITFKDISDSVSRETQRGDESCDD